VRIDRKPWNSEADAEDGICPLSTDTGQPQKFVHRARHLAAMALDQCPTGADDRPRLGSKEPQGPDDCLDCERICSGERRCRRKAAEQARRYLVDPNILRLSRQNRRDQQLETPGEAELCCGRVDDSQALNGERRSTTSTPEENWRLSGPESSRATQTLT
jgi:hypothetical protein